MKLFLITGDHPRHLNFVDNLSFTDFKHMIGMDVGGIYNQAQFHFAQPKPDIRNYTQTEEMTNTNTISVKSNLNARRGSLPSRINTATNALIK